LSYSRGWEQRSPKLRSSALFASVCVGRESERVDRVHHRALREQDCALFGAVRLVSCPCRSPGTFGLLADMVLGRSSPSKRVFGYSSPIVALRKELDLYANIRPVLSVGPFRDETHITVTDARTSRAGLERPVPEAWRRSRRRERKHRMSGTSLRVSALGNPTARWMIPGRGVTNSLEQYVKQEVSVMGEHGREARATRLITERASMRIGKMACEIALQRPRKVRTPAPNVHRYNTRLSFSLLPHPHFRNSRFNWRFFPGRFLHESDLAHASCFTIYPARHDHPQVKRLVCD